MSVVFFGRLAYIFANTFAAVFAVVLRFGARAFRRVFRRYLQLVFTLLLRPGSDYAPPRYCLDLLMFFAVCPLNV